MRRARPLRAVLLTWHITAAAGWFTLLAVQIIVPWQDLKVYLAETAVIAMGTGLLLALTSPLGLFKHWWIIGKLIGSLVLINLGALALRGYTVPAARWVGLVTLWILVWLSVTRSGGRTAHGRNSQGRHRC